MRKLLVLSCLLVAFAASSFAQDSKAEIFGGYQYTNVDNNGASDKRVSLNGWNAALTGYFNNNFGITADFSGAYGKPEVLGTKIDSSNHFFLFGPTVRTGADKTSVFAHALFGAARAKATVADAETTDSAFAMAIGGGLDVKTSPKMSIRVGQFDYLYTHFSGEKQNNFRYSAGVVFHF